MSFFLITGVPGTGKTTVCDALKRRGFDAYDADEDGLAQWFAKADGRPLEPGTEVRTPEFVASHERSIAPDRIRVLGQRATAENPVFICGDPENEAELLDLFTGVVALTLDETAVKRRLAVRVGNDWGKKPHELEQVLAQHAQARRTYVHYRYVTLDAARPVAEIVDAIIGLAAAG